MELYSVDLTDVIVCSWR